MVKLKRRGSLKTPQVYVGAVKQFTGFAGFGSPERLVEAVKRNQVDVYEVLDGFVGWMVDQGKAPKTIQTYFGAVKKFLELEGIELNESKLKRIEKPRKFIRASDRAPTHQELRQIFFAAPSLKTRVMVAMLASSGMRIGELLNLKIGDIDFSQQPTRVYIQPWFTKTKQRRVVFISDETTELLKQYLGERIHRKNEYVFPGIEPKKPLSGNVAYRMIMRAIKRAGLLEMDRSETRYVLHPHSFRKFFFTQMLKMVGREFAEALLGHQLFLDSSYLRFTEEELAKAYQKGMKAICFIKAQPENEILQDEVKKLQEELEKMKQQLQEKEETEKLREKPDQIMSKLIEDPEVQKVLVKKIRELGLV